MNLANKITQIKCFFFLNSFSFSLKIVLVNKFARDNLALKTLAPKILNSRVVIYLSRLRLLSLFSISIILVL